MKVIAPPNNGAGLSDVWLNSSGASGRGQRPAANSGNEAAELNGCAAG